MKNPPVMRGEELREMRQRVGLTQKQLAGQVFVHITTISRWETGKRRIHDAYVTLILGALLDAASTRTFGGELASRKAVLLGENRAC